MADPIAILGAVTGSLALSLQGATYLRDRPKLAVRYSARASLEAPAEIVIDVANNGRQPITLTEAGLLLDHEVTMSKPGARGMSGKVRLNLDAGQHRLPAPGGTTQYVLALAHWPNPLFHADLPLRPYVVDSGRRTHWAGAAPILRSLLNFGWEPPADTPPMLLKPITEAVEVSPVEPPWKLWKPKGLRKRRSYIPEVRQRPTPPAEQV